MAKKTAVQLQREIDEALRSPGGKQPLRQVRVSTKAVFTKAAKTANDQIYDLLQNKYFKAIPNDDLFAIVKSAGFRFDPEEEQFILLGRDGRATWQLYDEEGREVNHMLVLNWHKMESGRYEVVAYIS